MSSYCRPNNVKYEWNRVVNNLRNQSTFVKIVLITGFRNDEYLKELDSIETNISKVIHKPITLDKLLEYVHDLFYSKVSTKYQKTTFNTQYHHDKFYEYEYQNHKIYLPN